VVEPGSGLATGRGRNFTRRAISMARATATAAATHTPRQRRGFARLDRLPEKPSNNIPLRQHYPPGTRHLFALGFDSPVRGCGSLLCWMRRVLSHLTNRPIRWYDRGERTFTRAAG
jgi:hypothetical protein